jgi:hypothetical protein
MNLTPPLDFSLYQLALDTLTSPQSLSVSPTTLKSLVGAMIDVLIEEQIPVTLWVKLPPTEGWLAELNRYQQQVDIPKTIYLCSSVGDDLEEVTNVLGQAADPNANSQILSVQLTAGSQLEQEYFLILLCDQFSSLIVAYQPGATATAGEGQSQPLQAVCSFERQVIQRVLEEIRGVIAVADTTPNQLLSNWETLSSQLSTSDEKALLTQLLVKHVQRTEEMLHSHNPSNLLVDSSSVANNPNALTQPLDPTTATPPSTKDDLYKDELLKRVAQELRTPLTNMKTALRLLDSTQLKSPQRQRYMRLLYTECDRQNSLIAGLLDLVQLNGEPQPTAMPTIQLADIVPGVVSTYQPIAQEKGIQLGYSVAVGLPSVSCLETWLRQIVINLLNNSLKFTLSGGQVRVQVTLQGEYVQLAVSDTGIGISPAEIPKIFDSFYRGRSTTGGDDTGAGLGLTLVHQLLLRCGGSISVTSRLSEGSTFKVLLPIACPTAVDSNY